ncbi:MAG: (Fe-S)-binding protein [Proteobacteria bacterium]|nr:(Fe-S)-binding protein [Pseudomonadota bacterium]
MRLEILKEDVWQCNHCSMCSEMVCDQAGFYKVCPVYQLMEFENYTARGHNTIALYLLEGSLNYNRELAEVIFKCTTCKLCEEVCKPMGNAVAGLGGYGLKSIMDAVIKPMQIEMKPIPSVAIMEAMRTDCVEQGLEPDGLKELAARVTASGNIYGKPAADRLQWAAGLNLASQAPTILFAGDTAAYEAPEVAQAAARVLQRIGISFSLLSDERASGAVLFRTGNIVLGEKMARHNLDLLKSALEVICLSAGDYYSLSTDWPKFAGSMPFKVNHISMVLADAIKDKRLRFSKNVPVNATYEDPCYLGRGMNQYADPRIVLKAIPGLTLTEMYPTAHGAWCCGNCGGIPDSDPELSIKLGVRKLSLIEATRASLVATSCPEVKVHLKKVFAHARKTVEVKDIVELAAQAIGE